MKNCPKKEIQFGILGMKLKPLFFILYIQICTGIHNPFDVLVHEEPSISDIFE
jgi:hypothetical protein